MREVIVVEGRDDTRRLYEVLGPDTVTIETNGSAIDQATLDLIAKAHRQRGVIVFTDPDFAGQKIRNTIQLAIPTVRHAFLEQSDAQSSKSGQSLGVEHADAAAIRRALDRVRTVCDDEHVQSDITQQLLLRLGLVGGSDSARLRDDVTTQLAIGHTNGKQLLKRLHLFGITQEQLVVAVQVARTKLNEKVEG